MTKLTNEELNGLSPRARKAYEDKHGVISEILTINPVSYTHLTLPTKA